MHGHKDPEKGKMDTCKSGMTVQYIQANIKFNKNWSN
jgi:hypothetical protein